MSDSTEHGEVEQFDMERLEALIQEDPGAPEFPALAEAYRRVGRAEDARRVSVEGLRHAPARLAGHVSLGLALLDLNDTEAAQGELAGILDAVLEPHRIEPVAMLDTEPASLEAIDEDAAAAALYAAPEADNTLETSETSETFETPEQDAQDDDGVFFGDFQPAASAPLGANAAAGDDELTAGLDDAEIDQAFDEAESRPDEMVSANRMAERVLLDHAPAIEDPTLADQDSLAEEAELTPVDTAESEFAPTSSPIFHTATMANLLEQQGDHQGAREIRDSLDEAPDRNEIEMDAATGPDLALDGSLEEEPMDAAMVPEAPDASIRPAATGGGGRKAEILATLESWLHNLRRGAQ